MLLRLTGHEARMVHSGADALEAVGARQPEVILLDIGMPGMDGYEVARRLRAKRELDPIVLIALTGWGQEQDRQRSREAGFDLHMVKPVDPRELQAAWVRISW